LTYITNLLRLQLPCIFAVNTVPNTGILSRKEEPDDELLHHLSTRRPRISVQPSAILSRQVLYGFHPPWSICDGKVEKAREVSAIPNGGEEQQHIGGKSESYSVSDRPSRFILCYPEAS
jgi:hypothetical protein